MRDLSTLVEYYTGDARTPIERVREVAARSILAAKRALRDNFPPGLVHDPVVEIMMSVFLAESRGTVLSHDQACDSAGVGRNIARRWIAALEQQELLEITGEGSAASVALTPQGLAATTRAIDAVLAQQTMALD